MNYLLLSVGILLMSMSAVHCRSIRDALSKINRYIRNEDGEHLFAYGVISLALAVIVVWGIGLL